MKESPKSKANNNDNENSPTTRICEVCHTENDINESVCYVCKAKFDDVKSHEPNKSNQNIIYVFTAKQKNMKIQKANYATNAHQKSHVIQLYMLC